MTCALVLFLALLEGDEGEAPKENPNLLVNGDLKKGKIVPEGWEKPDGHGVVWDQDLGVEGSKGVSIRMDKKTAFGYGQGYFSNPVRVDPDTEYRVSVDIKSDKPNAIVFVKGFAKVKGRFREVYSKHKEAHFDRYLDKDRVAGRFVNQAFTFHPRHATYRVDHVKVWLYGYLKPGTLCFDNVRVERLGKADEPPPTAPVRKRRPVRLPDSESSPPMYLDPEEF